MLGVPPVLDPIGQCMGVQQLQIGYQELIKPVNFDKKRSRLSKKYQNNQMNKAKPISNEQLNPDLGVVDIPSSIQHG